MMNVFLVFVEESDIDKTERNIQAFSSAEACHAFLAEKVEIYKQYEWADGLRIPPECPVLSYIQSLQQNELECVYEFEHQSVHHDFFCINIYVKKTQII